MSARRTKLKPFRPPKPVGDWPEAPRIDGAPPFHGDEVVHPERGVGRYAYVDWVDDEGNWVSPTLRGAKTQRDTTRGHWEAIVTTPDGTYRCPLDELSFA